MEEFNDAIKRTIEKISYERQGTLEWQWHTAINYAVGLYS
jgi:hypothetical protein